MTDALQLPKPGDMIGTKYRVERLLGRGGMGAVYEVSHRVTGKRFAVKLLLSELTKFKDAVKRFVREAQVAGRFQHPNVVEIYDIGDYADTYYLVMELLQGESLDAKLAREERLAVAAACRILLPCLDGVGTAHAAGIIHRDIKPANIFLCEARGSAESVPKLLDFGISKLIEAPGVLDSTTTDTGTVMGTPFYMSPEQLSSKPTDHRADIYALGVTLYQLLTGRHPFLAATYAELVIKIWSEMPTPIETLVTDVPPDLARVIARAMARRAEDRFATAEAMAHALAPFAGGATFVSTAPNPRFRAPSPLPTAPFSAAVEVNTTPLSSESFRSHGSGRYGWKRGHTILLALGLSALAAYVSWVDRGDDALPHPQPSAAAPVLVSPPPAPPPALGAVPPATPPSPAPVATEAPEPEPLKPAEPVALPKSPVARRSASARRTVASPEQVSVAPKEDEPDTLRRPTPTIGSDQF